MVLAQVNQSVDNAQTGQAQVESQTAAQGRKEAGQVVDESLILLLNNNRVIVGIYHWVGIWRVEVVVSAG